MSAVDLYSGSGSLTGVNFWNVDKSPLDQLLSGGRLPDLGDFDFLEAVEQWLINVVGPAFQNLTGLIISGPIQFLQSLFDLLGDITVDIMSIFTQLGDATGLDFANGPDKFLISLLNLLGNIGEQIGLAVEDVLKIIAQVLSAPAEILGQGIAGVSDWVLDTIFGLVAPDRIPILPIGHLIFDRVNLLTNPQFTDEAIQTLLQGDWLLDGDVTHSGVGSSARIDADSTENTLLSVDLIPVHGLSPTNAQQMHIEAWVKTEGFVGPPGCVRVSLAKYKTIDGSDTPTYKDLCLPTQFGDTEWRQWTEDWIVEPGVVSVRYVITVSEEATGGQIWFDDLFLGKNGLLNANWVDGLGELFENFAQLAQDFAAQVWATLEDVAEAVGGAIADLIELIVGPSAFDTLEEWVANVNGLGQVITDVVNGIGAAITEGITNFVETVFGGFNDFNSFEEFITSVLNSLKPENIFEGIKDTIDGLIGGAVAGLASLGDVATAIADSVGDFIDAVVAWIKETTGIDLSSKPDFFGSFAENLSLVPVQLSHLDITMPGFPDVGAGVTAAINNLQATLNAWQQALTGRPPDAQQPATAGMNADEIAELLATTAANTTALAALQTAMQGGLTNMVASGDDFERTNPNGVNPVSGQALWQEKLQTASGRGRFFTERGQAVWRDESSSNNVAQYRRINPSDAKTVTAYQKITRVTGTTIAESSLLTFRPGVDYLYARVSDDFTQYMFSAFDGDGKVSLGYTNNGVAGETVVKTETVSRPTAGTSYSIECGDAGDRSSYRVLRNNVTVLAWQDSAVSPVTGFLDSNSQLGNRGWGWGGKAVTRLTGQSTPSSMHSITVADIPPEPTLGSFVHVVRRSNTTITDLSGEGLLPPKTFDDVIRNSPDLTFDLQTGVLLVAKPGTYTLTVRLDTSDILTSGDIWELLFYRIMEGDPPELMFRGGQIGAPNGFLASSGTGSVGATFTFYSSGINQQYAVGMNSPVAERILGSADGANTWLTVSKGT